MRTQVWKGNLSQSLKNIDCDNRDRSLITPLVILHGFMGRDGQGINS